MSDGVISSGDVYGREEFLARTKLGDWAFRQAKRQGLRTSKVGNRTYVTGRDWLDFLAKNAQQENQN